MRFKLITDDNDFEIEWDSYCAQIDVMGNADVLAVYQTAYERWNGVVE